MRRKGGNATPLTTIAPSCPRRPILGLLSLTLSASSLVLLFALLLGSGTNVVQAIPSRSRWIFSNPVQEGCYEPGNLAPNPSFECAGSSPAEPADWEAETYKGKPANIYRTQLVTRTGGYSVVIDSGSTASKSRWQTIPIEARSGRIYEFSVWVKAERLSDIATVSLTFWSGWPHPNTLLEEIVHTAGTGNTSGSWVYLVESHLAPAGTQYIRLECHLYGAGTAYFDDASIREYTVEPILDLVQVDDPEPVHPGESLLYTLTYSNTGNTTATNVFITDTFDTHIVFTGEALPLPNGGSNQIWYWHFPSLQVDGPHQIVITTTVSTPLTDHSVLYNRVEWSSDQTVPEWDLEETSVRSVPILTIVKTDTRDPIVAGERLTYTIAYTNSGTAPMTGILLLEDYPSHTEFVSATPPPSNPENTLWLMPNLPVAETQSVTIVLSTSASAAGTVLNTALFDSSETSPVFVTETTTISGTQPPFSMEFSPSHSAIPVEPGQPVMHPYYLGNTGCQTLTNISIETNALQNWKGDIWVDPNFIDSLPPGRWLPVILIIGPATDEISGTYDVQVTAVSNETSAQATATVLVAQHVDVLVEPDSLHYAHACDSIVCTHWVSNLGNFTDTILIEVLPSVPWPVHPISDTLTNVRIGETRPFPVAIEVPCNAEVGDENRVIVSATSTTGLASEYAVDDVIVRHWEVFLPVVIKPYVELDPFCNGDFADALSPCWTHTTAPPAERICSSGSCFARLGTAVDDAKCEGGLTPGTAELMQTFTPTATGVLTLSFEYQVHSQDVLWDIYDTLKVYVDSTPILTVIHEHDPYGCDVPPLIVGDTAEEPISAVNGVPMTLKFSLINRDTWLNTYADIHNVRITYAP